MGVDTEVLILALIVPDLPSISQPSVMIGTNTVDRLYKAFSQQETRYFSPPYGHKHVLKTLELRQKQNAEGNVGLVRLPENHSQVIPAGQSAVFCGTAYIVGPHFDKWVVVEHPSFSPLPCGLIVKTCMATLWNKRHCHLPVVVANPTAHDITIPPRCVVAELKAVQSVYSEERSDHGSKTETIPKSILEFNFGNLPIPPEWKSRLTEQL